MYWDGEHLVEKGEQKAPSPKKIPAGVSVRECEKKAKLVDKLLGIEPEKKEKRNGNK